MALTETPAQQKQLSLLRPGQEQFQDLLLQQAPNILQMLQQRLGQPAQTSKFDFAPIAQQAQTQFKTQTVPTLAERFGSLAGDSRGSSGVFGQLGAAGAQLGEGLAALQQHYGMQQQAFDYGAQQNQLQQLMQLFSMLSGQGLGQGIENLYIPRQPGFLENAGVAVAQGLGTAAGMLPGLLFA